MLNKDLFFTLLNRAENGNQLLEMIDALVNSETSDVLDQTVTELEEIAF